MRQVGNSSRLRLIRPTGFEVTGLSQRLSLQRNSTAHLTWFPDFIEQDLQVFVA